MNFKEHKIVQCFLQAAMFGILITIEKQVKIDMEFLADSNACPLGFIV